MATSVWYRAGTISIPANSKIVTGTNTKWADNKQGIGAGQMLLIPGAGTVQLYEIASIDSDTQITLNDALVGSAVSGSNYAIPVGLIGVKDTLVIQTVARLSYYQSQMDGWQQIMTSDGSVTLTAPDGTSVTISSFKKLTSDMAGKANLVNDVVEVAHGGTGAKTAEEARTNLELGNASTRTIQSALKDATSGRLMMTGAFGLGIPYDTGAMAYADVATLPPGLYYLNGGNWNSASGNYGGLLSFGTAANGAQIFVQNNGGNFMYRGLSNKTVYIVRSSQNTTVDSSGFIKQASPVARLTDSKEHMNENFLDGFTLAGNVAVNEEAEGVTAKKIDTGVYKVTGAKGLASDGWQIELPKDVNGNRLCFVELEIDEEGSIIIKVFRPKFDTETGGIIAGDVIDIPKAHWIDLRLSMPENSAYNLRMQQIESNEITGS